MKRFHFRGILKFGRKEQIQYCDVHHQENSRYDESRVGGICEDVSYKGWKILFYGLHDDFIHLLLATGDNIRIKTQLDILISGIQTYILSLCNNVTF